MQDAEDAQGDHQGPGHLEPIAEGEGQEGDHGAGRHFSEPELPPGLNLTNITEFEVVDKGAVAVVAGKRPVRLEQGGEADQAPVGQEQADRLLGGLAENGLVELQVGLDRVVLGPDFLAGAEARLGLGPAEVHRLLDDPLGVGPFVQVAPAMGGDGLGHFPAEAVGLSGHLRRGRPPARPKRRAGPGPR